MKRYVLPFLITVFFFSLYGEECVFNLIKKDIYILNDTSYVLVKEEIKTIKEFSAKKKFSEYKIDYNSLYDTIAIIKAYTINGKDTIYVTDKEIHDITSPKGEGFPSFSYLKTKVVNFPGVKEGSKLYIKYVFYTKNKLQNIFTSVFSETNPIEKMEVNIYTNRNPIVFALNGMEYQKIEKTIIKDLPLLHVKEKFRYIIKGYKENIPPVEDVFATPPLYTFCPTLIVENTDKWEDLTNHLCFDDTIRNEEWNNIKSHLPKIGNDISDRLYAYIIRNFNVNTGVSIIDEHPQTRSVEEIFISKYGSTYEITRLFAALLKKTGIKYSIALLPSPSYPYTFYSHFTSDSFCLKYPSLNKMGHVGIIVNKGKHQTLLVFSSPYNAKNYPNMEKPPVIIIDNTGKIVYKGIWNMSIENKSEETYVIKINKNMKSATIKYEGKFYGDEARRKRKKFMEKRGRDLEIEKEKEINNLYYGNNTPIKPYFLINVKSIEDPVIITTTVKTDGIPVHLKSNAYSIPLKPTYTFILNHSKERHVPLRISSYLSYTEKYEIELPVHTNIVQLPESYKIEFSYFTMEQKVKAEKNRIIITRTVKKKPYTLSVEEFKKCYEKLANVVSSDRYSNIIITK